MHIKGLSPIRNSIRADICVAVDTAVRAGIIRPDIVAFDTAAVLALLIATHKERRACDALDKRLVNAAVMLDSVPCKVNGLRTGGKGKPTLFPHAGKLPCEAIKLFAGKLANLQPFQIAAVFGGVNVHKADYAFLGIRAQGGGYPFKATKVRFRGILIGEKDWVISPDHPFLADFFGELHKGFQTPGKLRDMWLNLPAIVVYGKLKIIFILL